MATIPTSEEEFHCAGGLGGRITKTREMLLDMPDRVLRGPYNSIKDKLQVQLQNVLPEKDDANIPQLLDAVLLGVPVELVSKVDPQFGHYIPNVSAELVWNCYKESLTLVSEVGELIKGQAQQAVMAELPDGRQIPSTTIPSDKEQLYLQDWKLSSMEFYRKELGLYDDNFECIMQS